MPLRINSNSTSDFAQRALALNNKRLADDIKVVGSGDRIQRAGDDAASLAISERLRSDTVSLKQASRNGNDGMALINSVEGSLNEVGDMLIRLRELAEQAATGTVDQSNRQAIQLEFNQLRREIDRIGKATEFNGQKLLDGSLSSNAANDIVLQIGNDTTSNSRMNLNNALDVAEVSSESLGIDQLSLNSQSSSTTAVDTLVKAIRQVIETRTRVGSTQTQLTHTISNLNSTVENLVRADSVFRDADLADGMATLTRNQILVQSATAMIGQANLNPQAVLQLL